MKDLKKTILDKSDTDAQNNSILTNKHIVVMKHIEIKISIK